MKSDKFIEWEDGLRLGCTVVRYKPCKVNIFDPAKSPIWANININKEEIILNHQFNVAPKLIDKAIHKANRLFKYYTFKQLPGAVIFLGSKL